jgi:hypothetical protein
LERAFCCNDKHRETLSHFGRKERLRKLTNCAINSSALYTDHRTGHPNFFIALSAVGYTAEVPFLKEDKFLGTFAKLPKATISFVISARLSVRMEQLGYHWTDFHEI